MKLNSLNKKLLKTAFFTSPLIAILCLAPVVIVQSTPSTILLNAILQLTAGVLCIWLINIGLYYLVEKYGREKHSNYLRYILSYLLVFGIQLIFIHIVYPWDSTSRSGSEKLVGGIFIFTINTIVLIIQNLHIVREKKSIIELENSRLKLRNAEATNQKLKQQIHPHFLFNSLNTLKTLTKKEPQTATDYVVRLSGFLRSALSSTNVNTVKLSEELELCMAYLEMQKIRFRSSLKYAFNVPDEVREAGFIPPFSIQLLLENAIKHNAMSRVSPLYIQILYKEGWINVRNNKQEKNISEPSSGMGLDNLAERYKILSGDSIVIEPGGNQFSVSIKVLDKEYSPDSLKEI